MSESEFTIEYWNERLKGEVDTSFIDRQIKDYGVKCLCESLKTNKHIIKLVLYDCGISLDGVKYLCNFLETNNTITSLDISYNNLGYIEIHDVCELLKKNQTITHLDLQHENFSNLSIIDICDMLNKNRTLTYLDISANRIDDHQTLLLCNALITNTTLIDLRLHDINISVLYLLQSNVECSKMQEKINRKIRENILKKRHDRGTILLFCRVLLETFNDLPLDVFKIIWKLSDVL